MPIQFQFDDPAAMTAQLNAILAERGAAIRRVPVSALRQGVFELLALCLEIAPKKTATFVRSITAVEVKISEDVSEGKVGSPLEYAKYLESGTGIFGPKGQPIVSHGNYPLKQPQLLPHVSRTGKVSMAYRWSIKGMKAQPTFAKAITEFLNRWPAIVQEHAEGWAA